MKIIMRKVVDQSKTIQEALKAVGTTITKKTFDNTLCCSALTSCSTTKVPMLDKANVKAHLVASEHLNEAEKTWEKVLWSKETKIMLSGINPTRTLFPQSSMEVKTSCFQAPFLLKVQDSFTTPKVQFSY